MPCVPSRKITATLGILFSATAVTAATSFWPTTEAQDDDYERREIEKQDQPAIEEQVELRKAAERNADGRADGEGQREAHGDARQRYACVVWQLARLDAGGDGGADSGWVENAATAPARARTPTRRAGPGARPRQRSGGLARRRQVQPLSAPEVQAVSLQVKLP